MLSGERKQNVKILPLEHLNFDVRVLSVQKHLKNLQRAKACDLDRLPPNLRKDAANEIAPSLTYIINLSLTTSAVPTDCKKVNVSPIYKSGSTTELENYHPFQFCLLHPKLWSVKYTDSCLNFLAKLN